MLTSPIPDEPVEPSDLYMELIGCLMYKMTCTRPELANPLGFLARFVANGSVKAEIYASAMAAQELRWLIYLLADIGERPSFAPTWFADWEGRLKHIDLRYFHDSRPCPLFSVALCSSVHRSPAQPLATCLSARGFTDQSLDRISPRAVPCVFLGFPEDSSDYTFYHPPLYRFFDSRDVCFDESVPYYVRYPCRGLPVPPPPVFLSSASPPSPPVQPPPPGPAPSGAASFPAVLLLAYSRPCGSQFSWRGPWRC
ncbi:unnamed protein product [Closterium sp. NIES-53]